MLGVRSVVVVGKFWSCFSCTCFLGSHAAFHLVSVRIHCLRFKAVQFLTCFLYCILCVNQCVFVLSVVSVLVCVSSAILFVDDRVLL